VGDSDGEADGAAGGTEDGIRDMEGADVGVLLGTCDNDGDWDGAGVLKVGAWEIDGLSDGLAEGTSVGDTLGVDEG
jgi:hypothetical protein